jgi:hypothetical protein
VHGNSTRQHPQQQQQEHATNATESEDVTETTTTTTVRRIPDVVNDDVSETIQLNLDVVSPDDVSANVSQVVVDRAMQTVQQAPSATTAITMPSIEQMTSRLQNINLFNNDEHTDCERAQDHNQTYLSAVTADDENDIPRSNGNEPLNVKAIRTTCNRNHIHKDDLSPTKIMSLDRTYHESKHQFWNTQHINSEESNGSDDCWTEEECGTATSADFMKFPVLHENQSNMNHEDRTLSQHYYSIEPKQTTHPNVNIDHDDYLNCASSIASSSSGCTIHLSIRSCRSSVTWYEGSNIDEIDISCDSSNSSDLEDEDDALSNDVDICSTFT